jgi:hypothetical protein
MFLSLFLEETLFWGGGGEVQGREIYEETEVMYLGVQLT